MDYSKYKNTVTIPNKPYRPVHPGVAASAQEYRDYADKLEAYEKEMKPYREAKQSHQDKEVELYEAFRTDALEEAGLTGHPAADRAYSYAYDRGRSGGMNDIMVFLNEIAEVVLGCDFNPMRKLMLTRINEFKKEHNGFPKSSMRWQHVTFRSLTVDNNAIETHISNLKFENLNDADLLEIFEKIIRRHYVQM